VPHDDDRYILSVNTVVEGEGGGRMKVTKLSTEPNRGLCLWLTVFGETEIFKSLARVAILQS